MSDYAQIRRLTAALLAVSLLLFAAGLVKALAESAPIAPFSREDIRAAGPPDAVGTNSDYFLEILVDAVGIDYSTPEKFLQTLLKHPRGNKREHSVGHAWLILGSPLTWWECSHTGEFGVDSPGFSDTIQAALQRGDPNPLACLWKDLKDGSCEMGAGGHTPTTAVRFDLSKSQYEAIRAYIDNYNYQSFSIQNRVCTDFVTGAAALGGIQLGHRVALTIPQQMRFRGRVIQWWTDSTYSHLSFGSPDVLEKSLKLAIEKKLGQSILDRSRRDSRQ